MKDIKQIALEVKNISLSEVEDLIATEGPREVRDLIRSLAKGVLADWTIKASEGLSLVDPNDKEI